VFRRDFFVYTGRGRFGGEDQWTRMAKAMQFVEIQLKSKPNGSNIENGIRRFGELKAMLASVFTQRKGKPVLVVRTWNDIKDQDIIEVLVEHSFSVIVTDIIGDIDSSKIVPDGKFIEYGPILKHIVDIQDRMRSHLDGRKNSANNSANKLAATTSINDAKRIWKEIRKAATEEGLTSQSAVAQELQNRGITTSKGGPITQNYVSKVIDRLRVSEDWQTLKSKIKNQPNLI
jgi:hypothetical protein